jgi:arylsulfatase
VWETSPLGPFDAWPTGGGGFEHFYGFLGGETNQYAPALYDGTVAVEPDRTPEEGYHFTEDMTDHAIDWIRQQKSLMPDKPFFVYYAPGATHAPHHVPVEWSAKYKGKFDQGWDALREETLARQKELGVVPQDAELTERPKEIPAWDETPDEMKPIFARQMEVYAGFMEHTDHHVGRVIDALEELELLDDTLVYVIVGDNGASAEGTPNGCFNELVVLNGAAGLETVDFMTARIDDFGTPKAYNHYSVAWAHAMCTPYQWTKQVASHYGGTRNGTIVHWPAQITGSGEVRNQWHHVIDIAPTILDVARLAEPHTVNGVTQIPMHGVSMAYSFNEAAAGERHTTQYFELMGNRGIYHNGWTAQTKHRTPWDVVSKAPDFSADMWELYDTTSDWTQSNDLATSQPAKLAEMQQMFLIEAARHNVFPIDDRAAERMNPELAGRPTLVTGTSLKLYPGMIRLGENVTLNVKNRSYSVTAQITVPDDGALEGAIVAQGGRTGGWSFFAEGGKLGYHYNYCGLVRTTVLSEAPIGAGAHQVRVEFAYDGGGIGKGGDVTLYIDGTSAGTGRVEHTHPLYFSFDEGMDAGRDTGMPAYEGYATWGGAFSGTLDWAEVELGLDDHSHLIDPEEHLQAALRHQ